MPASVRGWVRRVATGLMAAALASACASKGNLRQAQQAERAADYDRAVAAYSAALRAHPSDTATRLSLERTKLRASTEHLQRGRRLESSGVLDQALVEYQLAAELNPTNPAIDAALAQVRTQLRTQVQVARDGKTSLQTLVARARDIAPPGLETAPHTPLPSSVTFRGAGSRDVFLALGRLGNLTVAFDAAFREVPVTIDLRSATLDAALAAVAEQTRAFYRVTGPRSILIIPDTPSKRREYEEEVVRTFYLSNADVKETMDLLRMVLDARRVSPTTAANAITVKDTPEHIAAAGRIISAIDKARPEVVIDVELLEVDRTKLQEYGLQFASPSSDGINGTAVISPAATSGTATPGVLTLRSLQKLSQSDVLLANLPSLYYRLLKNDTNTRTLANPQLRTTEGIAAQARFGERIPVPVTTFAPIATGGTPQQPITSFNYENIGVNIDITPRTHHDDDVSLSLKVAVQSISGTGFGGLPTFGNREINTAIRLRDGETNMLAGLIRDDERKVVAGIPGLVDLPVLGRLFARSRLETTQTDIVLTLTPHVVRVLEVSEEDLRAFRVGGTDVNTGTIDVPLPVDLLPRPSDANLPSAPPRPAP